jgi:hypothetical protein
VHELADIWKIGNMALAWAREPLGLTPGDLESFNTLCHRYGLEPSLVLYAWQKIAFPDLLHHKLELSRAAARMPDVSGGGVPYSYPQARQDRVQVEQTAIITPAVGHLEPPPGYPLVEALCGDNKEHPAHNWNDSVNGIPGEWYHCHGDATIAQQAPEEPEEPEEDND